MKIVKFGNPLLRSKNKELTKKEIKSKETQKFISSLTSDLKSRNYGVGLSAPQVGKNIRLAVIGIKSTPTRPDLKKQELVIINPKIIKTYGKKTPMWESCISLEGDLFAKVPRYKKISVSYCDQSAEYHEQTIDGFLAHVFQHEVDHLNQVLFVDRVEDTKSYMASSEYKKMIRKKSKANR